MQLLSWTVYLTLNEVSKAILCLLLMWTGWHLYTLRIAAIAGTLWFTGQAIDEGMDGNLWANGIYEYPVMGGLVLAVVVYLYSHAQNERRR